MKNDEINKTFSFALFLYLISLSIIKNNKIYVKINKKNYVDYIMKKELLKNNNNKL